jgi:structural maintenance of chromosome 4
MGIGRATFVILEKQTPLAAQMDQFKGAPEGVPRLFDLVKAKDERLRPAFYYALRDTVVAQDLAQAQRVANNKAGRLRAVSLAGELIDTSGTMSGGGARVQRGGMSSKFAGDEVSPQQLRKEEKLVEELERRLQECLQARSTLEARLAELEVCGVAPSGTRCPAVWVGLG